MVKINFIRTSFLIVITFVFLCPDLAGQRTRVVVKPTPKPIATPQITQTPTPTPTPSPIQTTQSLRSKIDTVLRRPELQRGHVGVKIISLESGNVLFEENAEKFFMPASNMKVLTVATALQKLSPNFKFVTSVFAPAAPDINGVIKGDLTIYGRGDISFSSAFSDGDQFKGIDDLVNLISKAGVKRIEGDLVGDTSYFRGFSIPGSWEWDDLQWYWGAGISALSLNDNSIDLRVLPGSKDSPCIVQMFPDSTLIKIKNTCTSTGLTRTLRVNKRLDQDIIEISGSVPVGDAGFSGRIAVSDPGELFIAVLRQRLEKKGILVSGRNGVKPNTDGQPVCRVEIAKMESTPLSIIAQKTMKPSQNLYTETLLWTLGEQFGDKTDSTKTSSEKGISVVKSFLQEAGVAQDSVVLWDGSGLSRHNLVTPGAIVQVYRYMSRSPYAIAWNASLTIGGIDGTLRNRFKDTSAYANVRGKTGTIDQVSSLSGNVTSASGEKFVFSIIVNGVNPTSTRVKAIDEIVVALSDFNGRSDQP